MINKIKDFLKNKLGRKRSSDLSDQEDFESDQTGEHQLPEEELEATPSRWQQSIAALKNKFKKAPPAEDFESTGDYQLEADSKPGMKERLSAALASLRLRLASAKKVKSLKLPTTEKAKAAGPLISPSLGQGIENFLGRGGRETIHQAFLVGFICVVTYSLGKITALALKGSPTLDSARDFTVSIPFDQDFKPGTLAQVRSINPFRTDRG